MAQPPARRPGFSRRAQFGLFIGYVAAVSGIIVGLFLLLLARLDPSGFVTLRGAALDLTTPVSTLGRAGVRGFSDATANVSNWWDVGRQNRALRVELSAARLRLVRARVTEAENHRLRRLARLVDRAPEAVAATRIVASSAAEARRLAVIPVGRTAGVAPGMPVRSAEGLVGRVLETGRFAARVVLVIDGGSVVPVRLLRDGAPALAAGRGDGLLELRPLSAGANPFRRGDVAVTSGVGGIFAPGVPVALVTEVQGDGAVARPIADPARLDFVVVERPYAPPLPPPPPMLPAAR